MRVNFRAPKHAVVLKLAVFAKDTSSCRVSPTEFAPRAVPLGLHSTSASVAADLKPLSRSEVAEDQDAL